VLTDPVLDIRVCGAMPVWRTAATIDQRGRLYRKMRQCEQKIKTDRRAALDGSQACTAPRRRPPWAGRARHGPASNLPWAAGYAIAGVECSLDGAVRHGPASRVPLAGRARRRPSAGYRRAGGRRSLRIGGSVGSPLKAVTLQDDDAGACTPCTAPFAIEPALSRLSTRAWAEQSVHIQLTALFPARQSAKRGIFGDRH